MCIKSILLKGWNQNMQLTKGEIIDKDKLEGILDYMGFSNRVVKEYFIECNELGEILYG